MWQSLHTAPVLLYVLVIGYALLTVVAGFSSLTRRSLPGWFWTLSLLALAIVVMQIGAGVLTYLSGSRPRRALHLLYGVLVLAAAFIQYGLRPGGYVRRAFVGELTWSEARTVALISLTQFALLLRAWMTGTGLR